MLFTKAKMDVIGYFNWHVLKKCYHGFLHITVKIIPVIRQSICFICKVCQIPILMPIYIFNLVVFVFWEGLMLSVKRWLLRAHELTSISSKCRYLAGMVNPETSTQKELG